MPVIGEMKQVKDFLDDVRNNNKVKIIRFL